MTEIPAKTGDYGSSVHDRIVSYDDGTSNLVWEETRKYVDVSRHGYFGGSSSVTSITVRFYNRPASPSSEFVLFGEDDDMVRRDVFIHEDGREEEHIRYLKSGGEALMQYLCERPRSIGSSPSGLGGGTIEEITALYGYDPNNGSSTNEGNKNPLMEAVRLRLDSAQTYETSPQLTRSG